MWSESIGFITVSLNVQCISEYLNGSACDVQRMCMFVSESSWIRVWCGFDIGFCALLLSSGAYALLLVLSHVPVVDSSLLQAHDDKENDFSSLK